MGGERKGLTTKKYILDTSREIFNRKGLSLTIDALAREMDISKGRITNHFPTKDNLFLGIVADYEVQFQQLIKNYQKEFESLDFQSLAFILSKVMDIQFEYRCGIIYLNMITPSQKDLSDHIRQSFQKNASIIKYRLVNMVEMKLLHENILQPENLQSFVFVYVNMLTQWVVYHEMYDSEKSFKKVKPHYIRSVLWHSYSPYLTRKGLKLFEEVSFK